ncbi:hypothetical protein [Polaromonas eurypsychrophila]|uniref:Uncharacterized protein n=1 Tax=Polaromonas eurypsychrophila TaxID=1614635 RepID=A0A916WIM0_9BURK|nr:hypothetical protein [Polaromonas eurypsychrophila]GGB00807.1 hypothetical protein GCM10011496_22190 [Polaromonas eurypsychrophila]
MQHDKKLDYNDEDDEFSIWDSLEEQYGRPLTLTELKDELILITGHELTDEEFAENLRNKAEWDAYKEKLRAIEEKSKEEAERPTKTAEAFWDLMMCPPIDDDDSVNDARYEKWVQTINQHIRTSMDIYAVMEVIRLHEESVVKSTARRNALKRHTENHQLRDAVYTWADKNIKPGKSLDDAASDMAGKVVPLKWRTVREHLTEWKKLRSASTP